MEVGIFAEAQELRQRTAQAQRLSGAVVLGFSPPGEGKDFIAAAVRRSIAFRGGFGFFGKKTAREADVYTWRGICTEARVTPEAAEGSENAFVLRSVWPQEEQILEQ